MSDGTHNTRPPLFTAENAQHLTEDQRTSANGLAQLFGEEAIRAMLTTDRVTQIQRLHDFNGALRAVINAKLQPITEEAESAKAEIAHLRAAISGNPSEM